MTALLHTMSRVNILGVALDGLRRWYVAVPPLLMIGILAAIFLLVGAGQVQLHEAGERVHSSTFRRSALEALQGSFNQAQSGLRGYLLTGDKEYLKPYHAAAAQLEPRLERLRLAYENSQESAAKVQALQDLIGRKESEFGVALALREGPAPSRATAFIKTNAGEKTSNQIAAILDDMKSEESRVYADATTHWESTQRFNRWVTLAAALVSLVLVAIAAPMVYEDRRRRTALATQLHDRKVQLEYAVVERTRELSELSTHLQSLAEREKANLARELRDELGALLMGARIDVSWAEEKLAPDSDVKYRLSRVQQNLAAGMDLEHRIVEGLRPSMLDNEGLFAALRRQLKDTCAAAGLECTEYFPAEEPHFRSEASIALFRTAQEAFDNIVKHASAASVDITLDINGDTLMMRIADDGRGIPDGCFTALESHGLASMRHRVRALGGRLDVTGPLSGGTLLIARIPTARVIGPLPDAPLI